MTCNPRLCVSRLCHFLKQMPHHKEILLSKRKIPRLPECFEETPLGEGRGAIRQFRGPYGSHIREYESCWELHRDVTDPRVDPFGHLINDAPHILGVAAIIGFLLFTLAIITTDKSDGQLLRR